MFKVEVEVKYDSKIPYDADQGYGGTLENWKLDIALLVFL